MAGHAMQIDERLRGQLAESYVRQLGASLDVIYVVDRELTLRGYNDAWRRFALDNGGAAVLEHYPLGCSILDAMSPSLAVYYERAYRNVLESGKRFDHRFECSSPSVLREFQQSAYPLHVNDALLITNHVVEHRPMDRESQEPSPSYLTERGTIVQCSHCRRVRNTITSRWDWVPRWVESSPPITSHTFCPPCLGYYYPDEGD